MYMFNMPRRIQNVKNRIREEEDSIDNALKAAGLWEDGLSLNEKRQYYQLISDSKTLAEEEETRRQVIYTGSTGPTSKNKESKTNIPGDDSDPEITFESSFSKGQNNCSTPSSKVTETASVSGRKDSSLQMREESIPIKLPNITPMKGDRHIQSLLSNKSITICYTPEKSRNESEVKENIVSETDDDTEEENCDPMIINDKSSLGQKQNIEKVNNKDKANSDIPVVDIKESNEENECNISNDDSNLSKLNMVLETDKKTCKEISKSESGVIVNRLNSMAIGAAMGKSIEVDRSDEIDLNMPSTSLLSLKKNGTKMTESFVFMPNSINIDSQPLKRKHKLLNEKPNRAYFKASFETKTNCIKRIYSLIADWQSNLAQYQRSLLGPCKWGSPICVDRQLTNLLVKRSNKTKQQIINTFSEIDDSSASETRVSNKSSDEDDWEIFSKRKKTKTYRKHYNRRCNVIKQAKTNYTENDTEMDIFTPLSSDEVLPDLEVKYINSDINNEPNSPVASTSKINNNEAIVNDHQEMSSHDPLMSVSKFYKNGKKSVRKTFQLSPDARNESVTTEEFSSADLFECQESQSAASNEITTEEQIKINTDQHENICPNIEEYNVTPKSSQVTGQWITKRGSTKRRRISNSSSMPPTKRVTSENDLTVKEASSHVTSSENPNQDRKKKTKENILDLPAESNNSDVPSSTGDIVYTLPKEEETRTETESERNAVESEEKEQTEMEGDETAMDEEKEESASIKTKNATECPLCQILFPNEEVEAHASECNGPVEEEVEVPQERPSTSTRSTKRSRPKLVIDQPMDVMYVGTRPKASHSKN